MTEVTSHTVNMSDMQGSFFVLFLGKNSTSYPDTHEAIVHSEILFQGSLSRF